MRQLHNIKSIKLHLKNGSTQALRSSMTKNESLQLKSFHKNEVKYIFFQIWYLCIQSADNGTWKEKMIFPASTLTQKLFEQYIIINFMIEKIKQILKEPKELLTAASGLTLLALYYFYGRKQLGFNILNSNAKNQLEIYLAELVNEDKRDDIVKIAITQSTKTKCELRRLIISKVKSQMIRNNIVTLVNCSPLKLLNSGCECFLAGIDYKDPEDQEQIIAYLENAIKCQLVIQKTIVDIQSIKKQNKKVFILCDTNSMDTKVNIQQPVWNKFLETYKIDEDKLQRNYDLVFHVRDVNGRDKFVDDENLQITSNWANHKNFFTIDYNEQYTLEENVIEGVKIVQSKLLPYLPQGFEWKKIL